MEDSTGNQQAMAISSLIRKNNRLEPVESCNAIGRFSKPKTLHIEQTILKRFYDVVMKKFKKYFHDHFPFKNNYVTKNIQQNE